MTAQADPYVRVYYTVITDGKFEGIYSDDAALSAWLRLLLTADAMWPAPAPLPRSLRRGPLAKLVTAGLVDLLPMDSYRIHGLDAERGKRRDAAAAAASARWSVGSAPAQRPHSKGNAGASDRGDAPPVQPHSKGNAETMPLRAEQSKDEQSKDEQRSRASDDVMAMVSLVEELTNRPWGFGAGNRVAENLRFDVRDYGRKRVEAALRAAAKNPEIHDPNVLAMDAHKALNPHTPTRVNGHAKPSGNEPAEDYDAGTKWDDDQPDDQPDDEVDFGSAPVPAGPKPPKDSPGQSTDPTP